MVVVADQFFGGILPQQIIGDNMVSPQQALVHGEDIGCELRLVGAQGAGCVQDSGRHVPTGVDLQLISTGQLQQVVVALFEVHQSFLQLFLGGAGIQTHVGLSTLCTVVVHLCGEEVHLGLAGLTGQGSVMISVVDMMGQGTLIVKELGVDGPSAVFIPDVLADDLCAQQFDHLTQGHLLGIVFADNIAQAFVFGSFGAVFGMDGGGEPSLVNAATL